LEVIDSLKSSFRHFPSPTSANAPTIVSKTEGAPEQVIKWFTKQQQHSIIGRKWHVFYTKDPGYRMPPREHRLEGEREARSPSSKAACISLPRYFKFAPVPRPGPPRFVIPVDELANAFTEFKLSQMLDRFLSRRASGSGTSSCSLVSSSV
jgi:hypothetical protein